MKSAATIVVAAFAIATASAAAWAGAEVVLPRHPSPSPDGRTIAFSWQGDLWLVSADGGDARRLTAHPAVERHPIWSRDGARIAFSSDRHGSADVFVMPADGSAPPRRLTHLSVPDTPVDFSADGTRVLFVSNRDETIRRTPALYSVPVDGGTPQLEMPVLAHTARLSPDGRQLAFVRGGTEWTRQNYRGSANREIYLRDASGAFRALTDFAGDDDAPSWIDDRTLVYLSARSGRKNLHRRDLETGTDVQLTQHVVTGARLPRAAQHAPLIAYEYDDAIWTVSAQGGDPRRISITAPADWIDEPITRHVDRDGASGLAVSPDGETAAFLIDADIFVVGISSKDDQEIATPRTMQVTTTPGREGDIAWAPDGKSFTYTTDRAGQEDVYRVRRADETRAWADNARFVEEPVLATPARERGALPTADGKRLVFTRDAGDIVVADIDGKNDRVLLAHWLESELALSPDGRWLAYSMTDAAFNAEVFIVSLDGGEPYNVSRHPDDDTAPSWSPDGRRLLFLSKRHQDTLDVWGVWLTRENDERTAEGWLKLFKDDEKSKKGGAKSAGASSKDEPGEDDTKAKRKKRSKTSDAGGDEGDDEIKPELPVVTIDFERLWERARPLTTLSGDEGPPFASKDGKRVYFTAAPDDKRDLYSVRYDGEDLEAVTKDETAPSEPRFTSDGKTIFFLGKQGVIRRIDAAGKAGDPVPFEARYERVEAERRAAVFDEAVRAISTSFYDASMHGVDFASLAARYRPWALAATTEADFGDVMNLLLGELNASHMGYRETAPPQGEKTGALGALFDPAAGGPGILVREVLPDTPAARRDVALLPGERLLAVDGRAIGDRTNVYALLADTAGRPIELAIRQKDGTTRAATIQPVAFAAMREARYRAWVRQRQELVRELSQGRLGYIHIESMDIESFESFERELFSAADGKEGLVIDVRSNGGGWTTDYLMAVLEVRRHAYTVPRGAEPSLRAYPQSRLPFAAWTRPAITLCDEESYSNAEIFSSAFKTLGRGLTAGTPTFGAVISTGGTALLNGRWLRLPFRGWYVAGTGTNMENNGFVPDLVIPRPPAEDTLAAPDTQLARAVEAFLAAIARDPRAGSW